MDDYQSQLKKWADGLTYDEVHQVWSKLYDIREEFKMSSAPWAVIDQIVIALERSKQWKSR